MITSSELSQLTRPSFWKLEEKPRKWSKACEGLRRHLCKVGGKHTVTDLVWKFQLRHNTVHYVLDAMEKAGEVRKAGEQASRGHPRVIWEVV